jgi:hypothetical protein
MPLSRNASLTTLHGFNKVFHVFEACHLEIDVGDGVPAAVRIAGAEAYAEGGA